MGSCRGFKQGCYSVTKSPVGLPVISRSGSSELSEWPVPDVHLIPYLSLHSWRSLLLNSLSAQWSMIIRICRKVWLKQSSLLLEQSKRPSLTREPVQGLPWTCRGQFSALRSRTFCLPLYTVVWKHVLSLATYSPRCWLHAHWVTSEPVRFDRIRVHSDKLLQQSLVLIQVRCPGGLHCMWWSCDQVAALREDAT